MRGIVWGAFRLAGAISTATLAGCATAPDMAHDVLAEVMASQQASISALGRPGPGPGSGPGSASGASLAAARGQPQTASPPQGNTPQGTAGPRGPAPSATAALVGAGPDTLRRWLGEPRLLRAEGEAQVWLYHTTTCHLDLILYPEQGGLRVAYAAARASGTERRTEAACLSDLSRPMARVGG